MKSSFINAIKLLLRHFRRARHDHWVICSRHGIFISVTHGKVHNIFHGWTFPPVFRKNFLSCNPSHLRKKDITLPCIRVGRRLWRCHHVSSVCLHCIALVLRLVVVIRYWDSLWVSNGIGKPENPQPRHMENFGPMLPSFSCESYGWPFTISKC